MFDFWVLNVNKIKLFFNQNVSYLKYFVKLAFDLIFSMFLFNL